MEQGAACRVKLGEGAEEVPVLRELLNRLRWSPSEDEAGVVLRVRVRHDGEETLEEVRLAWVSRVMPGGVKLASGVFVPYHRVVSVHRGGERLWSTRRDGGCGED